MDPLIIAYDLGTGGNKASLFDLEGSCQADLFVPYQTYYPRAGWHEQRPEDWWSAIINSTRQLIEKTGIDPRRVTCLGISGHSLGAVPLDKNGDLLRVRPHRSGPMLARSNRLNNSLIMCQKVNGITSRAMDSRRRCTRCSRSCGTATMSRRCFIASIKLSAPRII